MDGLIEFIVFAVLMSAVTRALEGWSKKEGRAQERLAAWRRDRPWSLAAATGAFTFVWVSLLLAAPTLAFHDPTLLRGASFSVVIALGVFLLVGVYNTRSHDS